MGKELEKEKEKIKRRDTEKGSRDDAARAHHGKKSPRREQGEGRRVGTGSSGSRGRVRTSPPPLLYFLPVPRAPRDSPGTPRAADAATPPALAEAGRRTLVGAKESNDGSALPVTHRADAPPSPPTRRAPLLRGQRGLEVEQALAHRPTAPASQPRKSAARANPSRVDPTGAQRLPTRRGGRGGGCLPPRVDDMRGLDDMCARRHAQSLGGVDARRSRARAPSVA